MPSLPKGKFYQILLKRMIHFAIRRFIPNAEKLKITMERTWKFRGRQQQNMF